MESSLKIAVVDEDPTRTALLEEALREAGHSQIVRITPTRNLLARIEAENPHVVLIDLATPSREVLERTLEVSRAAKRPVTIFVDQSDTAATQAAVEAGVAAYIVGNLRKERIASIVDLCVSRFNAMARLQDELERARTALEERKLVDRAKGILMKVKDISEDDAYALLRKGAMNENRKIVDIAKSVITAAELLK
jgi:response regulator NasT